MNVEEIDLGSTSKTEITSFKISKDKALKNLLDIIEVLDEEGISTRSKSEKSLKSKVQNLTVTDLVSVTQIRTRGTNNNEEMLYIVNFDNEEGYAVLSADERIPDQVLSIIEEGSLFDDDFLKSVFMTQEEIQEEIEGFEYYNSEEDDTYVGMSEPNEMDGTMYLCNYMVDYAEYSIDNYEYTAGPGYYTYQHTHNWETVGVGKNALLETKWHQGDPFNDICPVKHNILYVDNWP